MILYQHIARMSQPHKLLHKPDLNLDWNHAIPNFKKWARRNYVESLVCFYVEISRHLLSKNQHLSFFTKKV